MIVSVESWSNVDRDVPDIAIAKISKQFVYTFHGITFDNAI